MLVVYVGYLTEATVNILTVVCVQTKHKIIVKKFKVCYSKVNRASGQVII